MAMEITPEPADSPDLDMDARVMVGRDWDIQEECESLRLGDVGELGQILHVVEILQLILMHFAAGKSLSSSRGSRRRPPAC